RDGSRAWLEYELAAHLVLPTSPRPCSTDHLPPEQGLLLSHRGRPCGATHLLLLGRTLREHGGAWYAEQSMGARLGRCSRGSFGDQDVGNAGLCLPARADQGTQACSPAPDGGHRRLALLLAGVQGLRAGAAQPRIPAGAARR